MFGSLASSRRRRSFIASRRQSENLSRLFFCQDIGFIDEVRTQVVREHDFIVLLLAFGNSFFTHEERIECFSFRSLDPNSGA